MFANRLGMFEFASNAPMTVDDGVVTVDFGHDRDSTTCSINGLVFDAPSPGLLAERINAHVSETRGRLLSLPLSQLGSRF